MDEFDLIAEKFLPLTDGRHEAFGLKDDGALVPRSNGEDLVTSLDSLIEGVHFLAADPPETIGEKLLRVNLSDLAAMGARPEAYLLAVSLGQDRLKGSGYLPWMDGIVAGLRSAQLCFGLSLLGGDTTAGPGPTSFSVTIFGRVPKGRALRRDHADAGDDLYVSGSLGDGALGLAILQDRLSGLTPRDTATLVRAYRLPEPRLELGQALLGRDFSRAAMDLSDGLMGDVAHLARASGIKAEIFADQVPLSDPVRSVLTRQPEFADFPFGAGDDYELLFAAGPDKREKIADLSVELGVKVCRVGRLMAGQGVRLLDAGGREKAIQSASWRHF
ncbi:MAG: thiamine-phosphate kinase [Pseudomonadota bacterium]